MATTENDPNAPTFDTFNLWNGLLTNIAPLFTLFGEEVMRQLLAVYVNAGEK